MGIRDRSGMVESTSGCISEHALEHILSGVYKNLPHGAGLIMLSVAYFSKIAEKHTSDDRLVELAKLSAIKTPKRRKISLLLCRNCSKPAVRTS